MLDGIFGDKKIIFIAEIGLNHGGDISVAMEMIEKAADAGADAVKFQTFVPERMNSPYTASLMKEGSESLKDYSIIDFFRTFSFTPAEWRALKKKASDCGVLFFSAPFDSPSVDLLEELGVKLYKVASSEVTNPPLLKKIASTGKPVIMSTGMSSSEEISVAITTLEANGSGEIILLHCVSLYPLDDSEANISRIASLREKFGRPTGISDHSRDYTSVMIASALGACVVEKHFKLSDDHDCPDRDVSLSPSQFSAMVNSARRAIIMSGDGRIEYRGREANTAKGAKRSLFASRDIPEGKALTEDDIICLRPGTGIPAGRIYEFTGRKINRSVKEGALLRFEYFN